MTTHNARPWIEGASVGIEGLAAAIIVVAITYAAAVYLAHLLHISPLPGDQAYRQFRVRLGKALQLGLEILVAADVVRTIALEPTLQNVLILGILVIIRTFLSWSLFVELEGRWPWKSGADAELAAATDEI